MDETFLENIQNLTKLEFYVLCPSGRRILAQDMCKEFRKERDDPSLGLRDPRLGYAYRSFDNRLVIVVEAIFPVRDDLTFFPDMNNANASDKLYWRQAFYFSTGESSFMSDTWLPFSGIVIDANISKSTGRPKIIGSPWFSKMEYGSGVQEVVEPFRISMPPLTRDELNLLSFYNRIYGRLYLPEINFIEPLAGGRPFDRWGCPSFVLASHALGGNFFRGRGTGERLFNYDEDDKLFGPIIKRINIENKCQECFLEMRFNLPPTNIQTVNMYIDKHKALPIMNAFRELGVFPPGLSFVQVPFLEQKYSIPVKDYYYMLLEVVHYHWKMYKLNKITAEEIRKKFSNPQELLKEYLTEVRRNTFMFPNVPHYKYNIWKGKLSPTQRQFLGGTKKKRKTKKNRSRKH